MPPATNIELSRSQLKRLRGLAQRLEDGARLARNGDNTSAGERTAIQLDRDAAAVNWVLGQLDPEREVPLQFLEQLSNIGGGRRTGGS